MSVCFCVISLVCNEFWMEFINISPDFNMLLFLVEDVLLSGFCVQNKFQIFSANWILEQVEQNVT